MNLDVSRSGHPVKRRATPIPVAPPRIPTPMPSNNNNTPRSNSKDQDSTKNHPSSVGSDIPKLITKASYKILDNDVKTAWINPRLISKVYVKKPTTTQASKAEIERCINEIPPDLYKTGIENFVRRVLVYHQSRSDHLLDMFFYT